MDDVLMATVLDADVIIIPLHLLPVPPEDHRLHRHHAVLVGHLRHRLAMVGAAVMTVVGTVIDEIGRKMII